MKNRIIAILACATLVSCNAWLDGTTNSSDLSEQAIWESKSTADLYINGFYTYLHKYGQFGTDQFQGSLMESLTDELKYGSVALGNRAGHPNVYVTDPSAITLDGCLYSIWGSAYTQIRRVNGFLDSMEKYSKFDEQTNILYEAQARFFRAFLHFQLAKRHPRGIIYYKELPTSNDKALNTPEEVWEELYQDLLFAAKHLPVDWPSSDKGRITKGGAWAMMSRTMLYAERWQDAYDAADSVIALNKYDLMPEYKDAWKGNNKEAIIEFDYNKNGVTHTFDQDYLPFCFDTDYGALGTPTQEMVECYEKADGSRFDWSPWHSGARKTRPDYESLEPRFHATIFYNGSSSRVGTMDCSVGGTNGAFMKYNSASYSYGMTTTGYFLRKLIDENHTDLRGIKSTQSWVEMRYAEVLLNKAEAAYQLGRSDYQAPMNLVRNRVGLPEKNLSGEAWFEAYINERKVELAYEGQHYWDLLRWRLAHERLNDYQCHAFRIVGDEFNYESCDLKDRKFDEKCYCLPIPTQELRENNLINEQFPEWR